MNSKNLPYLIIALLVILCMVLLGLLFRRQPPFSKDILSITRPVNVFQGKIETVSGNTITVRQDDLPYKPGPTINPEDKITYTVRISKDTALRSQINSFYPLPQFIPPLPDISERDELGKGISVEVLVKEDLRTLQSRTVDAQSIFLPPAQKYIIGTIESIAADRLKLKEFKPIILTADTEYYDTRDKDTANGSRIKFADIKSGDSIVVFTNRSISSDKELTARRVVVVPKQPDALQPTPKMTIIPPGQTPSALITPTEQTPLSPVSEISPDEYVAQ